MTVDAQSSVTLQALHAATVHALRYFFEKYKEETDFHVVALRLKIPNFPSVSSFNKLDMLKQKNLLPDHL